MRAEGYRLAVGPLTFRLAREFGFCYGVDRAVEYAYETRSKFPDRRIRLVGEIIHNPHVNARLGEMGIEILHRGADGQFDFSGVSPDEVILMPAFGVTVEDFQQLRERGCVLVDTTCGSVLNVWKRVESYARDGFTAVIHGKHYHEETRATASQVTKYRRRPVPGGARHGGGPPGLRLHRGAAPGRGTGGAAGRRRPRRASISRPTWCGSGSPTRRRCCRASRWRSPGSSGRAWPGATARAALDQHFRTFDTICSATQERQDAVVPLLESPPDLMLVVGGYNSSNTNHLAALCRERGVRTLHIEDSDAIDVATGAIRHQPGIRQPEQTAMGWLDGVRDIGLTAGASTPNNKIGETIARVCAVAGVEFTV